LQLEKMLAVRALIRQRNILVPWRCDDLFDRRRRMDVGLFGEKLLLRALQAGILSAQGAGDHDEERRRVKRPPGGGPERDRARHCDSIGWAERWARSGWRRSSSSTDSMPPALTKRGRSSPLSRRRPRDSGIDIIR